MSINQTCFTEYDDTSKDVLLKVVRELREQWAVNECRNQFWFYPTQSSDEELTEQIVTKWLKVLKDKGFIYYFVPSFDIDIMTSMAIAKQQLDPNYRWNDNMALALLLNPPTDRRPGIAIDILDTDFDRLANTISATNLWGAFRLDELGRYYYGNVELDTVNCSTSRKAVLGEFLRAKDHTITADMFKQIIPEDIDGKKRRQTVYELGVCLERINRNLSIESHKTSGKVTHYTLTIK